MASGNSSGNGGTQGGGAGDQDRSTKPAETTPAQNLPTQAKPNPVENRDSSRPEIATFVVEAGDVKNSSFIPVDTLRLRIRGTWDNANFANGNFHPNLGGIAQMPRIPGIRLAVNPRLGKVRIFDPLKELPELCETISKVLSNPDNATIMPVGGEKVGPWPEALHDLDADQMKTLLLELARKSRLPMEHRTFTAVQGEIPTVTIVQMLPGRELYDMWSNSAEKPKYVDQVDSWHERLLQAGREGFTA